MTVFIGGAWPYANGSLHIGHISSLLPGDILARFYRLKGEKVLYVSGSDCNGTPIAIRAKQEEVEHHVIANRYHQEFVECFTALDFSYDCYSRTDNEQHHKVVQELFLSLYSKGHMYKKEGEQLYCSTCDQFLPDRYVEGICPNCKQHARGDQCDYCSTILEPMELLDKTCKQCGEEPIIRTTEHFYFSLQSFQAAIEKVVEQSKGQWRENAIALTKRYLDEGLLNRSVTRDLSIGVSIPLEGYENKKIYVWMEAVAGYLSASKLWAEKNQEDINSFWNPHTKSYYIHGKDNIPFHTIIWPALMNGAGIKQVPTFIVSNEYVTLEKKKISTSQNWAVWLPDLLKKYHSDSIRYFLCINAPEQHDTDFSWREFIYSHNSELLGAYGNFVNRTFKFIEKNLDGKVPEATMNKELKKKLDLLYKDVEEFISLGKCKQALETIFFFIRSCNKYFDEERPWIQVKEDIEACNHTIWTCLQIIANLSQLLQPFLPKSSSEVREFLELEHPKWDYIETSIVEIRNVTPLFERIPVERIEEERKKLASSLKN